MNIAVLKGNNSLFNRSTLDINQNDLRISNVSDLKNMQVPLRGKATVATVGIWMETQSTDELYKSTEIYWYR
ncbi:MAG TPA: hypothetical protein VE818_11685 [Nitrososphaeraceae archaeon]|nr:hypothetical protein [Nitrososphaeraceae archaeon]